MTTINVPLLKACSRCGQVHENVVFREMAAPIDIGIDPPFKWYATCPTTGEPIILRQIADWEKTYAETAQDPHYIPEEDYKSISITKHGSPPDENGAVSG